MNMGCRGFGRVQCIIPTFLWTQSIPNKTLNQLLGLCRHSNIEPGKYKTRGRNKIFCNNSINLKHGFRKSRQINIKLFSFFFISYCLPHQHQQGQCLPFSTRHQRVTHDSRGGRKYQSCSLFLFEDVNQSLHVSGSSKERKSFIFDSISDPCAVPVVLYL